MARSMEGAERVVNRIITCLKTYLPTELDDQDDAWSAADVTRWGAGRSIVLDDVPDGTDGAPDCYYRTDFIVPQTFPCCYVIHRDDTAHALLSGRKDKQHRVDVFFYLVDPGAEPDRAISRLWRTLRAAELALENKVREGGDIYGDATIDHTQSAGVVVRYDGTEVQMYQGMLTGTFFERVEHPLGA